MLTLSELWSKGAAKTTPSGEVGSHANSDNKCDEANLPNTSPKVLDEQIQGQEEAVSFDAENEPPENQLLPPPDNSDQLTLRRFFAPRTMIETKVKSARLTRANHLKPKRSILPHDLSEHWSTSRSAPSVSACPAGRRPISESETEFVTPVPMRKRATVAVEWRTPVITPQKPTLTGTRKKRHLITEDSFALKRPCWRVHKKQTNS